jgi:hypothetical protein
MLAKVMLAKVMLAKVLCGHGRLVKRDSSLPHIVTHMLPCGNNECPMR